MKYVDWGQMYSKRRWLNIILLNLISRQPMGVAIRPYPYNLNFGFEILEIWIVGWFYFVAMETGKHYLCITKLGNLSQFNHFNMKVLDNTFFPSINVFKIFLRFHILWTITATGFEIKLQLCYIHFFLFGGFAPRSTNILIIFCILCFTIQ